MCYFKSVLVCLLMYSSPITFAQGTQGENRSYDASDLQGTWILDSWQFFVPTPNGQTMAVDFCNPVTPTTKSVSGILIYSEEGYMSASINCTGETEPNSISKSSNDMLFYSGSFEIKNGNLAVHHVQNASLGRLMGTDQERTIARLDDRELVLTGKTETPTGNLDFKLIWHRNSQCSH